MALRLLPVFERLDVLSIANLIHYDVLLANDSMYLVFVFGEGVVVRAKNQNTAIADNLCLLHHCIRRVCFVLPAGCHVEFIRSLGHTSRVSSLLWRLLVLIMSDSAASSTCRNRTSCNN